MSAFVVCKEHIDAILTWVRKQGFDVFDSHRYYESDYDEQLSVLGSLLLTENTRAVEYRYREQTSVEPVSYTFEPRAGHRSIEILAALRCLAHQSCECDDWEQTRAYRAIEHMESIAISRVLRDNHCDTWEIRS
jgi:hypothetical protein